MASLADVLAYSQELAKKYTSLDTPQMTLGETAADIGMGFVPGLGTAQAARDFERARRGNDYWGMGLSAAGMIPVVGGVVKAGKAATKSSKLAKALEAAAPEVKAVEDYRGVHTAPSSSSGSPMHDLSNTYPDDIYGSRGAMYYGHYGQGHPQDRMSVNIISSLKNKPDASVTIYRAVPKYEGASANIEKIADIEKQLKSKYLLMNKSPHLRDDPYLQEQIKSLESQIPSETQYGINSGDWVTINKDYAKEHGESALQGNYKILSKKVKAKDIFTNGDSIHEWGYDPQIEVSK